MKNLSKCFLLSFCVFLSMAFTKNVNAQQSLTNINGWNAYVHLPSGYATSGKSYPTIIFFPGLGEVGTVASKVIASGPGAYLTQGWNGNVVIDGTTVEFIVISLQPSAAYPTEYLMNQALQLIKGQYRVDPKKLYLTGLSHGGWCSSTFVSGDAYGGPYTYASQIAAVVTVQGMRPDDNSPYPNLFDNYANAGGKYVGFEQRLDNRDTKTVVDRMNATRANSAIYVPTNFGGGGHCCWNEYYGGGGTQPGTFSLGGINQNIYQWMARQTLGGGTVPVQNTPPVANAGADKAITLPSSSTTLNGSGSDANGSIVSYSWRTLSGPYTATILNANSANATASSLIQGVYEMELTVTDNNGATATDVMRITVNPPAIIPNAAPSANAGADKTITLPTNSVSLSGSGSDNDGTISAYSWSKVSGPSSGTITNANSAAATAADLVQGSYQFKLTVTDNDGATSTDAMQVIVNAATVTSGNQIPTVTAGPDKSLTSGTYASLNGNGSDPDGWITAWQWRKISGPNTDISNGNIANAGAGSLVTGIYNFEIQATDNSGGTARDTMVLTVGNATAPANASPSVNAGSDITLRLPANTVTLSGTASDADGTIRSYTWTKISGPAGTLTNSTSASASLSALVAGVYTYEFTATDNDGASSSDRVIVTVTAATPSGGTAQINVNIYNGTTYSNAQWNNWNSSALTSPKFKYSDGTVSNINAILGGQALIADNGSTYASGATVLPPSVFRYNSASTSTRTLTIKGLDRNKQYDFVLVGSRASNGNKTVFEIGNDAQTVTTDNNISQVASFTNITPDNSGNVVVTLSRVGTWNYLGAFTISESGSGVAAMRSSNQIMDEGVANSVSAATNVRVFPNPFVSTINVEMNETISGRYTITLTDVSGRTLYNRSGTKSAVTTTEKINASAFPYGNYFIQVVSDSGKSTYQVQKSMPRATQY